MHKPSLWTYSKSATVEKKRSSENGACNVPKCHQTNEISYRHVFLRDDSFFASAAYALCFMKYCYCKRNLEGGCVLVLA